MTSDEAQRFEIARDERWLRGVCRDPVLRDVGAIKRRVRVATGEVWMERNLSDEAAPGLAADVERRGHAALSGAVRTGADRRGGPEMRAMRLARWATAGALVAAACVAVVVGLTERSAASIELPRLAAFEAYEEDEVIASLAGLEDDLTSLEEITEEGLADAWDQATWEFEELMDEVERPVWGEWTDDWS